MSEDQTLSYENNTDTVTTAENLSESEQESLKVGEEMEAQQEQLLAGKYKDASDLEKPTLNSKENWAKNLRRFQKKQNQKLKLKRKLQNLQLTFLMTYGMKVRKTR